MQRFAATRFILSGLFLLVSAPRAAQGEEATSAEALARLPLTFEANRGQVDKSVDFLARGDGYTLFLTAGEAVLSLRHPTEASRRDVIRMKQIGARVDSHAAGEEPTDARVNYFLGSDASDWQADVSTYARVRYESVYAGIDLVYYGNQRRLEYDFVVSPGANPDDIVLAFEGPDAVEIDVTGDLLLTTPGGTLRQHAPIGYQEVDGQRRMIACAFVDLGDNRIGFRVAEYDRTRTLVIDPILAYSTYLGGSHNDFGNNILVDDDGYIYIMGNAWSYNFPTVNAISPTFRGGSQDVFITKLTPDGQNFVFSTYLGGNSEDIGKAFGMDDEGNLYVTGGTWSSNYPTVNAFQHNQARRDAFVTKIDNAGSRIIFSTYLGGWGEDAAAAGVVMGDGSFWITGETRHPTFPTRNPVQGYAGGFNDAFVTRFNADGGVDFSSFLGGNDFEDGLGMAVDADGNAFVVGRTVSANFPTTGGPAHQGGVFDTFVVKIDTTDSVAAARLYGGSGYEMALGATVDSQGNLLVGGVTSSTDLETVNALQPTFGGGPSDAFLLKVRGDDLDPLYVTFLGGSGGEAAFGMTVDTADNLFVTLGTSSSELPLVDPVQPSYGGGAGDGYLAMISPDGLSIGFSTYLGGGGHDSAHSVALGQPGEVYVLGITRSWNFPTVDPLQANHAGNYDTFAAKILLPVNQAPTADASLSQTLAIAGNYAHAQIVLDGSLSSDPDGDALIYEWFEGETLIAEGSTVTVTFSVGVHEVFLAVSDGMDIDVGQVTVEVVSTGDASEDLSAAVATSGGPQGTANALCATLNSAVDAFGAGKTRVGINSLRAFQNKVAAQAGKKIDGELAQLWIEQAQMIMDAASS